MTQDRRSRQAPSEKAAPNPPRSGKTRRPGNSRLPADQPTPPSGFEPDPSRRNWLRRLEKWIEHIALCVHLYIIFEALQHSFGWVLLGTAGQIA